MLFSYQRLFSLSLEMNETKNTACYQHCPEAFSLMETFLTYKMLALETPSISIVFLCCYHMNELLLLKR